MTTQDFNFDSGVFYPNTTTDFLFGLLLRNIVGGSSNNFTSIWAQDGASLFSGQFQLCSTGVGSTALSVIDADIVALVDYYSTTQSGGFNESLGIDNIADLNVV